MQVAAALTAAYAAFAVPLPAAAAAADVSFSWVTNGSSWIAGCL
jgi:hypothetical protein